MFGSPYSIVLNIDFCIVFTSRILSFCRFVNLSYRNFIFLIVVFYRFLIHHICIVFCHRIVFSSVSFLYRIYIVFYLHLTVWIFVAWDLIVSIFFIFLIIFCTIAVLSFFVPLLFLYHIIFIIAIQSFKLEYLKRNSEVFCFYKMQMKVWHTITEKSMSFSTFW